MTQMAKGPLSGASLGLTGLPNSNPHLTPEEKRRFRIMVNLLKLSPISALRLIQVDRDNERSGGGLTSLRGPGGGMDLRQQGKAGGPAS